MTTDRTPTLARRVRPLIRASKTVLAVGFLRACRVGNPRPPQFDSSTDTQAVDAATDTQAADTATAGD